MGGIPLRRAFDEYKSIFMAARNYSEKTRGEYAHDVGELISFLEKGGVEQVVELGLPQIERFIADLDSRGIAGTTRRRKVVSIRSFLTFLYQNDYIPANLAKRIIPPLVDFKLPRYLTEKEYKRLLEVCSHSSRDFAIIQLLLQTGIKLTEITRLTINDIELPTTLFPEVSGPGNLRIRGRKRQKERVVPLNFKACQAIDNYLKRRALSTSAFLFLNRFGKRLGPRGVEKVLSKYFEQAGIEDATVQSLRHTFGTHHAAKGTNIRTIQATLGHSDPRSTVIYAELAKQLVSKELEDHSL